MRMTRSTARIFEDDAEQQQHGMADSASSDSSESQQLRAPLGDITGTVQNELQVIAIVEDGKKSPSGGPSARKTPRRSRPPRLEDFTDENVEVLEDEYQSETSSAAEEACRELLRDAMGSEANRPRPPRSDKISTPPSKAVKRARKQLKSASKTPRFDPAVHTSPKVIRSPTRAERRTNSRRDSFLDEIIPKTPAARPEELAIPEEEGEQEEVQVSETVAEMDEPVGSPSAVEVYMKRRSRIEDSFDALDAMEDMLDEVRDSLACVDRPHTADSTSPEHIRHAQLQQAERMMSKSAPHTPRGRSIETLVKAKTQERMPARILNDLPRRTASTRSSSKPLSTVSTNSRSTKTSRPDDKSVRSSRSVTKPIEMPQRPKPLISSVTKKPFVPVRSTKPPTTSSFTLPGEAVSARIKAQREARQANNLNKASSGPGATPVSEKRKSLGPEVRMTAAALARLQIAKGEKPTAVQRPQPAPKASSTVTQPRLASSRATAPTASTVARSAASRPAAATSRTITVPTKPPGASGVSSTIRPSTNTPDKRPRPISGVYDAKVEPGLKRMASTRSMTGQPATKKPATEATKLSLADRQEAAKRARAEAAERGRQASREWAERMKKRNSAILPASKAAVASTK